jgi:Xaa-Pro dipeptidase
MARITTSPPARGGVARRAGVVGDDSRITPLKLEPKLKRIMAQEYPRFSDAEYARRQRALGAVMDKAGVDHLLVITDHRAGNAPQWVTGWPGTVEAYVIFKPGEKMWMAVEWVNHFPLARKIARDVEVHWGAHHGLQQMIRELKRRGAKRVGNMGPLVVSKYRELEGHFQMVGLDAEYIRLRTIKSEEELDWLRIGAALSDAGLAALLAGTKPGLTERELGAIVESAYIKHGGATMIHYIGVTSMARPHIYVPPQHHSPRKVKKGDVVFCELSAYWWDYAGQVLRTFTVDAEPTPLYRDLHETAEAAFDAVTGVARHGTTMQEILDATGVIEQNGFTVCDDLMHGFGGGYFQPIIGTKSRMAGPLPAMTLEENMTVVVQPNVITRDHKAGVQVGELIRVTRTGFERLHRAKRGFFRVG